MRPELRKRIIAYNQAVAADSAAAADMRTIAAAFANLPPGQLKKVMSDDILAILAKYGWSVTHDKGDFVSHFAAADPGISRDGNDLRRG